MMGTNGQRDIAGHSRRAGHGKRTYTRPFCPLERDGTTENHGVAGQREMEREQGNEGRRPLSSLGAMGTEMRL